MKKAKQNSDLHAMRNTWNGVNPVTRVMPNKKHYTRKQKYRTEF